jgi:MFS family permease
MPGGVALITILAPLILAYQSWRAVWWLDSLLLGFAALAVALLAKKGILKVKPRALHSWDELGVY